MKKIALFALAAAVMAGGFVSTASAQLRIGTVDMKRVFENYYKTKDAEQRINEQRNVAKKELEDRLETVQKAVAEVRKLDEDIDRPELSATAKEAKKKDRMDKVTAINNQQRENDDFRQTREKQLQEQSVRMREAIVTEINRVVTDRVKSEQYDIVFDRSGPSLNGVPVILYAKESYDFTTDVVTALNRSKGTEAASPEPPVRAATTPVKKPKP
ncbi:MAG TPA: OmpH family outer membrane protein [Chthoniobacteraceae bacterium]|jgi:outer membrane protein|nr:OmpH family outer membrane protein [Chthoniobacteraceae bacterium]